MKLDYKPDEVDMIMLYVDKNKVIVINIINLIINYKKYIILYNIL